MQDSSQSADSALFKRSYYAVLLPLAVVALIGGWLLEWTIDGRPQTFETILLLGTAGLFAALLTLLSMRTVSVRMVDLGFSAGVAAFFLARLAYAVYFLEPGVSLGDELAEFAVWFAAYYGLLYLVFGLRAGRTASLVFLGLVVLISLPGEARQGSSAQRLYALSMLYLSNGANILIYHLLGRALIRFGADRRMFEHLAVTDSLTGLANRRGIEQRLAEEVARVDRYGGSPAVLLLDLDHFKRVNDLYGHDAGDQVLRDVAQILVDASREGDVVGRWGGEEFLVLLPHTSPSKATTVAERIREAIASNGFAEGATVTASIGVSTWRDDDTLDALIQRADAALYRAKDLGRDRVEFATE